MSRISKLEPIITEKDGYCGHCGKKVNYNQNFGEVKLNLTSKRDKVMNYTYEKGDYNKDIINVVKTITNFLLENPNYIFDYAENSNEILQIITNFEVCNQCLDSYYPEMELDLVRFFDSNINIERKVKFKLPYTFHFKEKKFWGKNIEFTEYLESEYEGPINLKLFVDKREILNNPLPKYNVNEM